jgi:hypothetical protein
MIYDFSNRIANIVMATFLAIIIGHDFLNDQSSRHPWSLGIIWLISIIIWYILLKFSKIGAPIPNYLKRYSKRASLLEKIYFITTLIIILVEIIKSYH